MTTYVRYGPEDRVIDLASLSMADYELIASLHCNVRSGDGTLVCLQPTAGNGEMHIVQRNGKYWAAHFAGGAHGSHAVALESDAHKREKEYWQRAAEDAGYEAAKEIGSGNSTILDVAIYGPVKTGIEVQHSAIRTPLVKARTTRSFRAGYTTVWFSDQDVNPPWFHLVPSLGCNRLPWHEMLPPRRAATATGLRQIEAVRCEIGAFPRCPEGYGRPCGAAHPKLVPWLGLTVDDVAQLVPAGEAVPLMGRSDLVYLVPPASADLYHELSGRSGLYEPGGKSRPRTSSGMPAACANPVHAGLSELTGQGRLLSPAEMFAASRERPPAIRLTQPAQPCTCPGCVKPAQLFPGGWWCSDHPCRSCQCNRKRSP